MEVNAYGQICTHTPKQQEGVCKGLALPYIVHFYYRSLGIYKFEFQVRMFHIVAKEGLLLTSAPFTILYYLCIVENKSKDRWEKRHPRKSTSKNSSFGRSLPILLYCYSEYRGLGTGNIFMWQHHLVKS